MLRIQPQASGRPLRWLLLGALPSWLRPLALPQRPRGISVNCVLLRPLEEQRGDRLTSHLWPRQLYFVRVCQRRVVVLSFVFFVFKESKKGGIKKKVKMIIYRKYGFECVLN